MLLGAESTSNRLQRSVGDFGSAGQALPRWRVVPFKAPKAQAIGLENVEHRARAA